MADELEAVLPLFRTINDNVYVLADMGRRGSKAHFFGEIEQTLRAVELDVLVDLSLHGRGHRALLG